MKSGRFTARVSLFPLRYARNAKIAYGAREAGGCVADGEERGTEGEGIMRGWIHTDDQDRYDTDSGVASCQPSIYRQTAVYKQPGSVAELEGKRGA